MSNNDNDNNTIKVAQFVATNPKTIKDFTVEELENLTKEDIGLLFPHVKRDSVGLILVENDSCHVFLTNEGELVVTVNINSVEWRTPFGQPPIPFNVKD